MKNIAILTESNSSLGSGHMQRMCALLKHFNRTPGYRARLITASEPPVVEESLRYFIGAEMTETPDIIIRDMRDSTVEEIEALRKTAPVMVIDDRGPGRKAADRVIDLLPHPDHASDKSCYFPRAFIYGYGFSETIKKLGEGIARKGIDLAIYAGQGLDESRLGKLLGMIPEGMKAVLLRDPEPQIVGPDGSLTSSGKSHAECLITSKVLMTHFGITMYEGFLTGNRLLILNPSEYHNELTALAGGMGIVSCGLLDTADPERVRGEIVKMVGDPVCESLRVQMVQNKIRTALIDFTYLVDKAIDELKK